MNKWGLYLKDLDVDQVINITRNLICDKSNGCSDCERKRFITTCMTATRVVQHGSEEEKISIAKSLINSCPNTFCYQIDNEGIGEGEIMAIKTEKGTSNEEVHN